MSAFLRRHRNLVFFLYLTLVFTVLYRRYLFGDAVYMFSDTGSDSMSSSYPIIMMVSHLLKDGSLSAYNLEFGLGESALGIALQYVNPVKFLLLLFGKEHFTVGILIQLYIQTLITGFAGVDFFRQITKNENASYLTGAIWAFTSYITLWSQNYSYGICIMMFTVSFALLRRTLDSKAMGWKLALAGVLGLFLFSNYYFYYMTAVFSIVYVTGWSIYYRKGVKTWFSRMCSLAFSGILSACMGLAALVANVSTLSSSSRTSSFMGLLEDFGHLVVPSSKRFFSLVARFYSPDLMGTGIWYHGYANYYEMAMAGTSLLFFFGFFYLIQLRKYRRKQIILWVLAFAALLSPLTGRLLLGASMTGRYSFFICLLECIYIAFFLTELLQNPDLDKLRRSAVITAVFSTAAVSSVLIYCKLSDIDIKRNALFYAGVPGILYFLLFLAISKKGKSVRGKSPLNLQSIRNLRTGGIVMTAAILAVELVFTNNAGVNDRGYLHKGDLGTVYFNDGAEAAAARLKEEDPSLYRIYGSTSPDYYEELNALNTGMVDSFYSTTARFNTPSASIVSLADGYDVFQYAATYFAARYQEYPAFTYLSGKYLLLNNEITSWIPDQALFEKKEEVGNYTVYENKLWLPFGYLYTNEMFDGDYNYLSTYEKLAANANYFYYSSQDRIDFMIENSNTIMSGFSDALPHDPAVSDYLKAKEEDILGNYENADGMTVSPSEGGLKFHADKNFASVTFRMPDWQDAPEDSVNYFRFVSDKESKDPQANIRLYCKCGEDDDFHLYNLFWLDTTNVLPEGVTEIKLELQNQDSSVQLSNIILGAFENPSFAFEEIRKDKVNNISFKNSVYKATVECDADSGMLCVPILYNKNWTASVNGKPVKVANINDGFIGIEVGKGTNEVNMTYTIPHMKLGILVSCGAIGVYLVLVVIYLAKFLKGRKAKAAGKAEKKISKKRNISRRKGR